MFATVRRVLENGDVDDRELRYALLRQLVDDRLRQKEVEVSFADVRVASVLDHDVLSFFERNVEHDVFVGVAVGVIDGLQEIVRLLGSSDTLRVTHGDRA